MKILLIAPSFSKKLPGESWSTFKWVEGISSRGDVTVLTSHKAAWVANDSPIAAKEVINWTDPTLPKALRRLDAELKPSYFLFYLRARKWIKGQLRQGRSFDIIHQINPLALRYPSPAAKLGIPYLIGPLAGSLPTPSGFASEMADKQWYRKLRNLDGWRVRNDPWLRRTYEDASAVVGVAPYVAEHLSSLRLKRFEIASETGVETTAAEPKQAPRSGEPLKLLFVGRIIRTKGVIDAIRAVASAKSKCSLQFNIVGDGDMRAQCEKEVVDLGLRDVVFFHGKLPRDEVTNWYKRSDVFLFPSFREPSGNVVFEAMSAGLPVIAANAGGPSFVVTRECGRIVEPTNPTDYAQALAREIIDLYNKRETIPQLSSACLARMNQIAFWPKKIDSMFDLYRDLLASQPPKAT